MIEYGKGKEVISLQYIGRSQEQMTAECYSSYSTRGYFPAAVVGLHEMEALLLLVVHSPGTFG